MNGGGNRQSVYQLQIDAGLPAGGVPPFPSDLSNAAPLHLSPQHGDGCGGDFQNGGGWIGGHLEGGLADESAPTALGFGLGLLEQLQCRAPKGGPQQSELE